MSFFELLVEFCQLINNLFQTGLLDSEFGESLLLISIGNGKGLHLGLDLQVDRVIFILGDDPAVYFGGRLVGVLDCFLPDFRV